MKKKNLKRKLKARPGGSLKPVGWAILDAQGRVWWSPDRKTAELRSIRQKADRICRVFIQLPNYLIKRKDFGLSPYWPINAELLALTFTMAQH